MPGTTIPGRPVGCAFLKLVVSRNGLDCGSAVHQQHPAWRRSSFPTVSRAATKAATTALHERVQPRSLRIGDELVYYYSASSYGKKAPPKRRITGGGIFRARLRRDGFVSIYSGVLTTPLLKFNGRDLTVMRSARLRSRFWMSPARPWPQRASKATRFDSQSGLTANLCGRWRRADNASCGLRCSRPGSCTHLP